ncbi:MAG: hypothetical protein AABN95_21455 [Acidobacteriota bacterium]
MSETIKRSPSGSGLEDVKARKEQSVILQFPQGRGRGQVSFPFHQVSENGHDNGSVLPLIKRLCEVLNTRAISYCHWKSNWRLSRWLTGEGDLDLLVANADIERFARAASRLGFVQAGQTHREEMPGILHLYGWDSEAEKFVHLHVYHMLLVGHDLTTSFRLPVEKLILQSVSKVGLVPVPQPEFELIVFVLRKVLSSWGVETVLRRVSGRSTGFETTAQELEYLEANTNRARVHELLHEILPGLRVSFFERCLESLRLESSLSNRTLARLQLEKVLAPYARRRPRIDGALKLWRLVSKVVRERLLGRPARKHLGDGGALIALVGGDGAGKTTAVEAVGRWLDEHFVVQTFHFGKPPRSPLTFTVIVALRSRALIKRCSKKLFPDWWEEYSPNRPGYLRILRWVCAGRDRHRVYLKARRFVDSGGIAICDRYVVPGILLMEGPNIARTLAGTQLTWFSKALLNAENKYYQQITQPDLLLVLRVDPDTAVRRKTDEKEQHVRTRSLEIWQHDWSNTRAHLVDASQPPAGVLAELRAQIWQQI